MWVVKKYGRLYLTYNWTHILKYWRVIAKSPRRLAGSGWILNGLHILGISIWKRVQWEELTFEVLSEIWDAISLQVWFVQVIPWGLKACQQKHKSVEALAQETLDSSCQVC